MKVLDKKVGDLQFCFGLPRIDIFKNKKLKKKERDKKNFDKKVFKKSIFKYLKRCD